VPFCSQCGGSVTNRDFYCGRCGTRQPIPGSPGVYGSAGEAISPRGAAMFCYVPFVGWIAALFVLGSEKYRQMPEVRFHAFQGLYLFVAWLLLEWAVLPWFPALPMHLFPFRKILKLLVLGLSGFMILKASQQERYSLPLIGDLAERSL
jgi:uncharacterized membrane protein